MFFERRQSFEDKNPYVEGWEKMYGNSRQWGGPCEKKTAVGPGRGAVRRDATVCWRDSLVKASQKEILKVYSKDAGNLVID